MTRIKKINTDYFLSVSIRTNPCHPYFHPSCSYPSKSFVKVRKIFLVVINTSLYLLKIDCQFISLCFSCNKLTSLAKAESIYEGCQSHKKALNIQRFHKISFCSYKVLNLSETNSQFNIFQKLSM